MQLLKTNNIKLTIEYNGLPYSGWQSQKNEKTIQSEIEKAIFKFVDIKLLFKVPEEQTLVYRH